MQLDELQVLRIQHMLKCLNEFERNGGHGEMVERDVLEECREKGITDREQQKAMYKAQLFSAQRMLHDMKSDFYHMLDEFEFVKNGGHEASIIPN